ncbi:MAG: LptF/LptG family permease [Planctomycetes bacterium]|nr:LptF/LptG family permease [Planctomycetota bacterium]
MILRLDRVVLRDTALTSLVAVLGITFLFTALGLYQIVNRFEVTPRFGTLVSFAPSLWVSLLPFSLPVSVLFSASLVFGRMRAERELLLLASSGVAPWRPFLALLPLGLLTAALVAFAVSELGPQAYSERHSLQRRALADFIDHPPQGPRELRFPGSGTSIDISYASFEGGHFDGLGVMVYSDEGLLASLTARRARIVYQRVSGSLLLTGCVEPRLIQFDPQTGAPVGMPLAAERINELRVPFDFGADEEPDAPKAMRTIPLMHQMSAEISAGGRRSASSEAARRIGLALGGLLLPLLGALLAALVSHPNRLFSVGVGVIPAALGYFPAMIACQGLAERGVTSAAVAASIPGLLALLGCAAVLRLHWRSGWA